MAEPKREWMIGHQGADGLVALDEVIRLIKGGQLRETEYVKRANEPWRAAIEIPELQPHFAARTANRKGTQRLQRPPTQRATTTPPPPPVEQKKTPTAQIPKVAPPTEKKTATAQIPKIAPPTEKKTPTAQIPKVAPPATEMKSATGMLPKVMSPADRKAQQQGRLAAAFAAMRAKKQAETAKVAAPKPPAPAPAAKPAPPAETAVEQDIIAEATAESSSAWPSITNPIPGSSVDDEETAKELHRVMRAALVEDRKADAHEAVVELIEKYGHTQHVKGRLVTLVALRRRLHSSLPAEAKSEPPAAEEFQPTLMPASVAREVAEAPPQELDAEPVPDDEPAEDLTADDALSQAQESSGLWPAIPPVGEGSSVEDEEKARELHRAMKAALHESRKEEARATCVELLEKLGHTKHVKDRAAVLDAVRRTLTVGGVETEPKAEEKPAETPAEKPKPKPRPTVQRPAPPPPPPPLDPLPAKYYSPADLVKHAALSFAPTKLVVCFASMLPFLLLAGLVSFIAMKMMIPDDKGKAWIQDADAQAWVMRIVGGFSTLMTVYGALLALFVGTLITRRQLESQGTPVGMMIRHVIRAAIGWIALPVVLGVFLIVFRGILYALRKLCGKNEGFNTLMEYLQVVPFVIAAVIVGVICIFWIALGYISAALAVESSTFVGAVKFARTTTRGHGSRLALHVFIMLIVALGAWELSAVLLGWIGAYSHLGRSGGLGAALRGGPNFSSVLYGPFYMSLGMMLPLSVVATLVVLSYAALRHPETTQITDGGPPDATEPGEEKPEPTGPQSEGEATNPSATQPGGTKPEPEDNIVPLPEEP